MSEWQPIETMPKKVECVVWCEGAECFGIAWKNSYGQIIMPEPQAIGYESLTHWMIPEKPNSQIKSQP